MASAGRILIMPKGDYDANSTYENLDLVKHKGTSWLAKKTAKGIEPSEANAEYWQMVVDANDLVAYEPWQTVTPLEGWTGKIMYSKNYLGQVRLRVRVGTGTNVAEGTVIAKIPEEYAPAIALPIPILKLNLPPYNSALGMYVQNTGSVMIRPPLTDNLTANSPEANMCGEITYWLE